MSLTVALCRSGSSCSKSNILGVRRWRSCWHYIDVGWQGMPPSELSILLWRDLLCMSFMVISI